MNVKSLLREALTSFRPEKLRKSAPRILVVLLAFPLLTLLLGDWVLAAVFTSGGIFLVDLTLRRYLKDLVARTKGKNDWTWNVEINRVKVGSITDAEYATIRHRVFSDSRVYLAQARNVFRVALTALDYLYKAIPITVFWLGIAWVVFAPEAFREAVVALQHASALEIRQASGLVGSLVVCALLLTVALHGVLGLSRFGFVNRFEAAIADAVRRRCSVAAEGEVVLFRWGSGENGYILNEEMAFFRRNAKGV